MAKFGPCSEPLCTETSIRLFDCAHHCMKLVCLQHLIEHDQLINSNSQCLNNLRSELEQLWTVYSTSIDETKLYSEFEQQLTKHQQLIQEVTNLIENDSLNIKEYQITLEKLKTSIEQEKQCIQSSSRSVLGELVKMECFDEPSSNDKPNPSNIVLSTYVKSETNIIPFIEKQQEKYPSLKTISGTCPFWFNGAFGLTQEDHGMYLCSYERYYHSLYRHLIKAHALTTSSARKICHAMYNDEDPCEKILFDPDDIVIDRLYHFQCPFSVYNCESSIVDKSSEYSCRRKKLQAMHSLRSHLTRFHQMTMPNANKLIKQLKINAKKF